MKFIAVTLEGIEDIASEEIEELINAKPKKLLNGRIVFETEKLKLLENLRTIKAFYSYITHFKFSKEEEIYKQIEKLDIPIKNSFAVRCNREGNHSFRSKNIEENIGAIIYNRGSKVKLKNPETTVYIEIVKDICLVGILCRNDLQKRNYKIRLNSSSVNACLAAATVRFAEAKKSDKIIDPFCKDGVILIEAGLMGFKNLFGSDENLNNVKNSRINSKVAGLNIPISKLDVDWLDTKFDEGSVHRIITQPPFPSKTKKLAEVKKVTQELFHQAAYILVKDGLLVTITLNSEVVEQSAKENSFRLVKEITPRIGDSIYKVQAFSP